jgi:hypothetical protein
VSAKDRAAIAALINDWVVFRDSGDWERFSELWAPGGKMNATWFSGSAEEFIARSRAGFKGPLPAVLHMLGGISVDVRGNRAVSQAKMTIGARATVHETPCEITCSGRFYDLWRKLDGDWKLVERFVIYERDRLDPIDGAAYPALDTGILATFPPGYAHLAYAQQAGGATVIGGLPGLTGDAVDALYANGKRWLATG